MKIAVCDDSFEFRKELLDRIQQSIPMSEEITFNEKNKDYCPFSTPSNY